MSNSRMGCDIGEHTTLAIILLVYCSGLAVRYHASLLLRLPWPVRLAMAVFST